MYENRLVFWSRVFLIEARYLPWTIKRIYHEAYRRLFYPHRVEVNYGGGRAALIVNGHVVAV